MGDISQVAWPVFSTRHSTYERQHAIRRSVSFCALFLVSYGALRGPTF